jgi:hypothetical protein
MAALHVWTPAALVAYRWWFMEDRCIYSHNHYEKLPFQHYFQFCIEKPKPHTMSTAHIAKKEPAKVTLKAGKSYAWCACGLSEGQPTCDGTHQKGDLRPMLVRPEKGRGSMALPVQANCKSAVLRRFS